MSNKGELIKIGFTFPLPGNQECVVEQFLGGGGQGEVYRVKIGDDQYALKWYFRHNQNETLKKSLQELVKRKSPSANFLWPEQVIELDGDFGYVMGLRPNEYEKSQKLLDRKFSLSYTKACNACLQLVDSFRKLHVKGLSYQDISWGNLFINPKNGDILICDNDNVAPHGSTVAGIAGTYGFMAPEVVRGENLPDQYTDLFSMAALLFQMLFLEHPLHGRRWANISCWDDVAKKRLYGTEPIFIFDPNDKRNIPEPGVQDNAIIFWNLYPSFIHERFIQSFTNGLTDRENGRVMEEAWIDSFRRLRASIFLCPHCGRELICDNATLDSKGHIPCWGGNCQKKLEAPLRLRISYGNRSKDIVLSEDSKIYAYQLKPYEKDVVKGDEIVGEVAQSPKDPSKWGIRNLTSNEIWHITNATGETKDVMPQKAFMLNNDVVVDFGNKVVGEVIIASQF